MVTPVSASYARTTPVTLDGEELALRLEALAAEILEPMICRTPAYGAPGVDHCAACCGGTRLVITDEVDQALADLAASLHRAAATLRAGEDT